MMCTTSTLVFRACAFASVFFCSGVLHAHNAHDEEIHRLDQLLQHADSTGSAVIQLLRRADLHRREANWNAALDDYQTIATIQPDNPGMLLGISQLHLDQKSFLAASQWSGKLLKKQSNHIQALMMHARAHAGLGNLSIVTGLYDRAIKLMKNPKPEHYLEHANAVLQSSRNDSTTAQAIAIVDAGAMRLNHPVSLHSFALKQEMQSEQFEAAVARIEHVLALNPRLWPWHVKKAELLVSLRRIDEACVALEMLEDNMQQIPPHRTNTPAMQSIWSGVDELRSKCVSQ